MVKVSTKSPIGMILLISFIIAVVSTLKDLKFLEFVDPVLLKIILTALFYYAIRKVEFGGWKGAALVGIFIYVYFYTEYVAWLGTVIMSFIPLTQGTLLYIFISHFVSVAVPLLIFRAIRRFFK